MTRKAALVLKDYFIPHPGNDHQPRILQSRALRFVLVVMLVGEVAFLLGSVYVVPRIKLFGLIESSALIDQTNQQRVANGDAALTVSPLLEQAAQDKANDEAAHSYFAHTSPAGATPWSWFEKVGYSFSYAGENLAVNFVNSQDVTNAWMNSPEHRANILNGAFTQIGIATAQGTYEGQPTIFVVEEFGTPASAPVAFVNTAAAASVGSPTPIPAPAPSKPVAIVVASTSVENSSSQQLFVAVKGAETQTVSATASAPAAGTGVAVSIPATTTPIAAATIPAAVTVPAVATATVPAAVATVTVPSQSQPQPNSFVSAVQWLASNPRAVANDFYIFLIALFALASILNIFVKIRVQFPRLILGGVTVIVIAGLFVMLNQSAGLLYAAII